MERIGALIYAKYLGAMDSVISERPFQLYVLSVHAHEHRRNQYLSLDAGRSLSTGHLAPTKGSDICHGGLKAL